MGEWRSKAACIGQEHSIFFPRAEDKAREAKAICARCPVREECLAFAVDQGIEHGVYGGLTEFERRGMARARMTKRPRPTLCAWCGGPMPADVTASRLTCSGACRSARLTAQWAAAQKRRRGREAS